MPVLKEPSSAFSHPFKGVKKWQLKLGHTTTGYNGVHIHFHDKVVKYGCSMKKLHSKGLQGRNDWNMTSRNWAEPAALISWLPQCSCHTHKSRDMANSDCHLERWELLMGKHRASCLSSEKQPRGWVEMEKGWQVWQQSPRLHSPAQTVTNSLPHTAQTDRGCFLLLLSRSHYSNTSGTLLSRLSCNHCWLPAY